MEAPNLNFGSLRRSTEQWHTLMRR
ncbi:hypothetical protein A2U01_0116360, partial [Trifolium medium]|nr:hypothetical protein [Trifolium medium]